MRALSALLLVSSFATAGCHHRVPQGVAVERATDTLFVKVLDADQRGEHVRVKAWFMNRGGETAVLDRAGMRLRLADGRMLAPSSLRPRARKPLLVSPGRVKVLRVDFEYDGNPDDVANASLVIAGENGAGRGECVVIVKTAPGTPIIVETGPGEPRVTPARPARTEPVDEDADDGDDDSDEAADAPAAPARAPADRGGDAWEIGGGKSAP